MAKELPIAPVKRLLKKATNDKRVSDAAVDAFIEYIEKFIMNVGNEINDLVEYNQKKTVTKDDIIFVMER